MATKQKVAVSERAVFQRVNRKLNQEDQKLLTARRYRGGWEDSNLGRYYVINVRRNEVVDTRVKLDELGRKLGVLKPWEELVTE